MGPFTQQDLIGIAGGLNLYGYANGDPVNFSDPFGLDPCKRVPEEMREDCREMMRRMRERLEEDEGLQEERRQFQRCMAKTSIAVFSGTADAFGAKPLALGVRGAYRMAGEVTGGLIDGLLGQKVRGITAQSSSAVAGGVLSTNASLASSSTATGASAAVDGSTGGVEPLNFVPIIGSGLAVRDAVEACNR